MVKDRPSGMIFGRVRNWPLKLVETCAPSLGLPNRNQREAEFLWKWMQSERVSLNQLVAIAGKSIVQVNAGRCSEI